jgi:hypothetical protein
MPDTLLRLKRISRMSMRKRARRLQLDYLPSRALQGLYSFAIALSLVSIAVLPLPLFQRLILGLPIVLLARRCWFRRCELGGPALTLIWDTDGHWWWQQQGSEVKLQLRPDTYLATGMAILNFHDLDAGAERSLVVLPACVGARAFRHLSVRLRLEGRRSVRTGREL